MRPDKYQEEVKPLQLGEPCLLKESLDDISLTNQMSMERVILLYE